ncbi:hypothetical protein BKI52_27340 [marine bacterium AO1-C]|nr:hypothetical protein BKI52_27340 [marine bacterium AO1-C]
MDYQQRHKTLDPQQDSTSQTGISLEEYRHRRSLDKGKKDKNTPEQDSQSLALQKSKKNDTSTLIPPPNQDTKTSTDSTQKQENQGQSSSTPQDKTAKDSSENPQDGSQLQPSGLESSGGSDVQKKAQKEVDKEMTDPSVDGQNNDESSSDEDSAKNSSGSSNISEQTKDKTPKETSSLTPEGGQDSTPQKTQPQLSEQSGGEKGVTKKPPTETSAPKQKKPTAKQSGGDGSDDGGGGRLINMVTPSLDGKAEALNAKMDSEQGKPKAMMLKNTEGTYKKMRKQVDKTRHAEKKKKPAVMKAEEAEKARVIRPEDTQSEQNKKHLGDKRKQEVKKTDKTALKSDLDSSSRKIGAMLPEEKEDFEDKAHIQKFQETVKDELEKMTESLVQKSGEVSGQYDDIDNPGLGEKPREAQQLPDVEAPVETPKMVVEELKTKQIAPDEQLQSIRDTSREADDVLRKEGIGDGQAISYQDFSQAKSEDLRRGIDSYEKIQEKSASGPDEIRKDETAKLSSMERSLKDSEQKKRGYMRKTRDEQLKASRGHQTRAKSDYEKKKESITARMEAIYEDTHKKVKTKLGKLDSEVRKRFKEAQDKAFNEFQDNVTSKLKQFHYDRYVNNYFNLLGPAGWIFNGLRALFEDTSDLPEVLKIFKDEKEAFIRNIDRAIADITDYVEKEVDECKQMIEVADDKLEEIAKEEGPAFQKIAKEVYKNIRKKLDKLDADVEKKAAELKKYLADQRKKAIEEVDKKIAEIKSFLKNKLGALVSFLVDAAYKFFKWVLSNAGFSTEQIDQVISQGKQVLTKIVTDPVGFFQNVINAVSKGFNGFVGNIGKHLKNGLFAWLTGAMGGAGIVLPQKWDLKGIFDLILQVLGLTWPNIRAKLAKEVGEENLAKAEEAAEFGLEIFQQIREKGFVTAMWDMLMEKAEMIKQMVMDEIKNWIITKIVKQAVIKILSMLNPAGAIVQAILAIYNFAMWLVNNWQRIFNIIQNVVSSVGKIAMGMLGEAAKFIENTLANFIPLLLDFLARMIGLGNISERIKKIIMRIRQPVDDLLDKIIAWVKKKIGSIGKKGKKGKKKDSGLEKKDEKDAKDLKKKRNQGKDKKDMLPKDGEIGDVVYFKNKGHRHRLWIKVINGSIKVIVNSNEKEVIQQLNIWSGTLDRLSDDDQRKAKELLVKASRHLKSVEGHASDTYKALLAAAKAENDKTNQKKAEKSDAKTEEAEDSLGTILWKLFGLFELEGGLSAEEMAALCRKVAHDIMDDKDVVDAKKAMIKDWETNTKGKPIKERGNIGIEGPHKPAAMASFLRDSKREGITKGTKETFQYEGGDDDRFKRTQSRGKQGTNALILTGKDEDAFHYLKDGYIAKLAAIGSDTETAEAVIAYMKGQPLSDTMEPHRSLFASLIGLMFGQEAQRSAVALVNASQVVQLVAKGRITWRQAFDKYFSMARDKAAQTARRASKKLNEKDSEVPLEKGSKSLGSHKAADQMIQDESDAANMWFETRVPALITKMQAEAKTKFDTKAKATEYLRKFMKEDLMAFMRTARRKRKRE